MKYQASQSTEVPPPQPPGYAQQYAAPGQPYVQLPGSAATQDYATPVYIPPTTNTMQPASVGIGGGDVPLGSTVRYHKEQMQVRCQHCQEVVLTDIKRGAGAFAWGLSAILVVSCCWMGCCCVPFFHKECLDVTHRCPNCKKQVGSYARLKV